MKMVKDNPNTLANLYDAIGTIITITYTITVIDIIVTITTITTITNIYFGNDQYQSNHQDIHLINGRELYYAILSSS